MERGGNATGLCSFGKVKGCLGPDIAKVKLLLRNRFQYLLRIFYTVILGEMNTMRSIVRFWIQILRDGLVRSFMALGIYKSLLANILVFLCCV